MKKGFNAFWSTLFSKDDHRTSLKETLQQIPIFENLSSFELSFIIPILHKRRYKAGELIFKEDEAGNGMYIVHSGAVQVFGTDAQGKQVLYAELKEKQFLGELSLVDGQPRSATAITQEVSELYGFFKPDLLDLIKTHPAIGSKILFNLTSVLGVRLRDTNNQLILLQNKLDNFRGVDAL